MPRPIAKNPRLVDRDYEILQHLGRYHITTREVLHRLFFSDSEENAVTKVTSRLTLHGFLNRYELYFPRTYFTLGPQATLLLGATPKKCHELGPQALIREFGTLAYCCLSQESRTRLTVSEIRERHPQLLQHGFDSSHYYLDNDGETTRLAHIRVDYGGGLEHIVRKCHDEIETRYESAVFKQIIDNDRFLVAIVTAHQDKVNAIHEAVKRQKWPCRFRIEAVPDLANLITRFEGV